MTIGIIGKSSNGWGTEQLRVSLKERGERFVFFSFSSVATRVGHEPSVSVGSADLIKNLESLIVRPLGRGSLEEIIYRMDLLHKLERDGIFVLNSATAIERCADKYHTLALLEESGLPVPATFVTESLKEALAGFHELGSDVVFKPIFGSQGIGSTRIFDADIAERIFRTARFHHQVLYLQKFIPHGEIDIRAFVVGKRVVAAMQRVGFSWKTNVSQGASPVAIQLQGELETLAVKAAGVLGCQVAGVDILESDDGPVIVELNSQPGWRGLQSVTKINIADCIIDFVLSVVRK